MWNDKRLASVMRPDKPIEQGVLRENRGRIELIERRTLLRGGISLGALTMLTGCDITNRDGVQSVLSRMSHWNDRVQAWLFDPNKLAPTFPESAVMKPPRFNAYYSIEDVKPVDMATWRLDVGGLVKDKRPWSLDRINALPKVTQITRHVCVEGWDYVGKWSGVDLRRFLETVGADLTAKYVSFRCADDYSGSIDMPSALHPQTQLATHYADEPIGIPYGYPLRLRVATKLGFKMPKWITAIEVTNTYPGGFWEHRDYNWFSGL